MSATEPNWAEKANLASNLVQNVQLHDIRKALISLVSVQAEWAKAEADDRLKRAHEDRLRELVWRLETGFKKMMESGRVTLCGIYVVAKQIEEALRLADVTTSSFRQFGDKDRLDALQTQVRMALSDAEPKLTPQQKQDGETYLRYLAEMPELEFMAAQYARQKKLAEIGAAVKKVQRIKKKIAQLQPGLIGAFFGVGVSRANQKALGKLGAESSRSRKKSRRFGANSKTPTLQSYHPATRHSKSTKPT